MLYCLKRVVTNMRILIQRERGYKVNYVMQRPSLNVMTLPEFKNSGINSKIQSKSDNPSNN